MSASTQNLVTIAQSLPAGVTAKVTVMKSATTRRRRSLLNKTNSSGRSGLGSHDTAKGSYVACLLYTSPSPRDLSTCRMPSSA